MFNDQQPTYQRLRLAHAERRRPIAFWIGAGFSVPAGLPTWATLRDKLIAEALEGLSGILKEEAEIKEAKLERAKVNSNYWDAFEAIKEVMGQANFVASIRASLHSPSSEPPELYKDVWRLPGVNAVLTLNMDGFTDKAHRRIRLHEDPVIFNGRDAPSYTHLLGARRPFIANLHGIIDDQTSWIFTKSDVNRLFSKPAYQDFLNIVFGSMTVVFAGISADDGAAGGSLAKLTERGGDLGSHFWITERSSSHDWASKAGVQVISVTPDVHGPDAERYTRPLRAMFKDLLDFTSRDTPAATVVADVEKVEKLPEPRELRNLEEDELRKMLSGFAKNVLDKNKADTKSPEYTNFLKSYSANIHQAWHITSDPPSNTFYGYSVVRQIHGSPFSTVWELSRKGGQKLALKLLRIENLRAGPQIESFRRGVQSLNYLTRAAVPGTAPLVEAYEIPTAVVMEYIEGASLSYAVHSSRLDPWPDLLLVMSNVCRHLIFSHNLPQGVLHRDVRPSNIMLPFLYWDSEAALLVGHSIHDVVLLNYDMSWHSNAAGQTITGNIEEAGYYAPEQLAGDNDAARSTLVDSYGVGMSLFYAFTRTAPPTGGSTSGEWEKILLDRLKNDSRLLWRSAPSRLRRLITQATRPNPDDRVSVTQIEAELKLLADAISGKFDKIPVDFWAEELILRSEEARYEASANGYEFVRFPREGRTISFSGNVKSKAVILSFKNQALGSTNRSGIDRIWTEKMNRAKEILLSTGWEELDGSRYTGMEILLTARVTVAELVSHFDRVLDGLIRGLTQVKLE